MSGIRSSDHDLPLTAELAGVTARMAGLLLTEETVDTALGVLSSLAAETVPGSAGAGVSIIDGRRRISSGSTDDRVRRADALQYELDEGPCLTAAHDRELIRIDDLTEEPRWPRWAAAVRPLGLGAAMSGPLVAGNASLGAIKVYADEPGTFGAPAAHLLTLFATQAAVLVANVQSYDRAKRLSGGMRQAIHDRDVVNLAHGVLMGRHKVDRDTALRMLLDRAMQAGTTLAEAARVVADSAVRRRQ